MSHFEEASRLKLRFSTNRGELSTEDLWELSLESLDTIAKATNKLIKADSEESFIGKKSTATTQLDLKLDILKRVIEVRLQERDARAARADKNAKLAQLRDIAMNKANEKLISMSEEDINKMISELEAS
jgi:hypothetical protein